MNQLSTRVIFVSIAFLFSLAMISFSSNAYGEEISVTSIAFEETSIIEVTNNSKEEIKTLRVWLGSDFSFKSFKTENGWVGEKTPQGVIVFTSSESIKSGDSVKFGVIADKPNPKINWKALDNNNKQIATGATIGKDIPPVVKNSKPTVISQTNEEGISDESSFRIVPAKPNVGSTIRVTGDQFGASQEFDFYIDSKKLGSFVTDDDGHFMTTMKIPENQKADRADFKIKDKDGEEKTFSLRIGEIENRIPISEIIPLTIRGIPDVVHRGDFLEILGTGDPNSAITVDIRTPSGDSLNARTAEINAKGNWELDKQIVVPIDAEFGKYSVTISDGRESIVKYLTLESDKVIMLAPTKTMFTPGELITFNGTVLPNIPIDLILEDSLGNEKISDFLDVDDSGIVEFQYQTIENIDRGGTWTLIATQGQHKELIYVGYDERLSIPVHIEFDKLNYKSSEIAHLTITGESSETLSMIVVTSSGALKSKAVSIELESNGKGKYDLKLVGFDPGIYNAVIKKGTSQTSEMFAVGLHTGSGDIKLSTPKLVYLPGDPILLLGESNPDSLLTGTLSDPTGRVAKVIEFPSDDQGKFIENRLRIPSNGISGSWLIKVSSGPNFFDIDIEVLSVLDEGIMVNIENDQVIAGFGKIIKIKVEGASPKSSVMMVITTENGDIIDESLKCNATNESRCEVPWTITKSLLAGTYTVKVTDNVGSAETTFVVD